MALTYSVSTGAILELTLPGKIFGQQTMTVLHYRVQISAGTIDGPTAIADLWANPQYLAIAAAYTDMISDEWEGDRARAQWIWPTRYAALNSPGFIGGGSNESVPLPPGTSVFMEKKSVLSGRHNRGGIHMPGVVTASVLEGRVTPGAKAQYDVLGVALSTVITLANGGTLRPIILNRATPADSAEVTIIVTMDTARTMRRRVVGRGI